MSSRLKRVRVTCLECGWTGVWEVPSLGWASHAIRSWTWCPGRVCAHRVEPGLHKVWDIEEVDSK